VIVALPACGKRNQTAVNDVRAAMATTSSSPRALVFRAAEGGQVLVVRAAVHDDLRYRASLDVDSRPSFEEVALDDALAARVLDDGVVALLRRPGAVAAPTVDAAIRERAWIVDPRGAPSLLASAAGKRHLGDDAVLDALTYFGHVRQALLDAGGAHRFNPDSLDYRPLEDPFPPPSPGTVRYDLERPRLPRQSDAIAGGARAVPGPANFRRMSIYVRDRRVLQILEVTDVVTKLKELRRLYDLGLPAGGDPAALVDLAVTRLNQLRRPLNAEPIRLRTVSLQFVDTGKPVDVALPADARQLPLDFFRDRGVPASVSPGAAVAGATP